MLSRLPWNATSSALGDEFGFAVTMLVIMLIVPAFLIWGVSGVYFVALFLWLAAISLVGFLAFRGGFSLVKSAYGSIPITVLGLGLCGFGLAAAALMTWTVMVFSTGDSLP